ncbi:MAG: type IV secretion protein IcmC [Legionellaceae bacterium]|nr:type IV secretion protein IcmC [Legionellaceae bacterium]HAF87134.1 type IV secretion protein IcmC [Legionellales bacterium]HCA89311.1 type IV secretion protein IcmC [Legionellales bacterium]|tara:strand:- start:1583 stop:2161 length:579 start_codon:yes stop_codon:yes gene_type:complete
MEPNTGGLTGWIAENISIINNIATSLVPIEKLVTGLAYLIGLSFIFKAILSLKSLGESRAMMSNHGNLKESLAYLVVGAVFVYFPTGLAIVLNTTFGSSSILQYQAVDSQNQTINTLFGSNSMVGKGLSIIIQVIGLIAFVRGWVLIAKSSGTGQQPGNLGKGMMHVFGGVLAMNIVLTLQIIDNTLYGPGS